MSAHAGHRLFIDAENSARHDGGGSLRLLIPVSVQGVPIMARKVFVLAAVPLLLLAAGGGLYRELAPTAGTPVETPAPPAVPVVADVEGFAPGSEIMTEPTLTREPFWLAVLNVRAFPD
jgi:hypothetical protein